MELVICDDMFYSQSGQLLLCNHIIEYLAKTEKTAPSIFTKDDVRALKQLLIYEDCDDEVGNYINTTSQVFGKISQSLIKSCHIQSNRGDDFKSWISSRMSIVVTSSIILTGTASLGGDKKFLWTSIGVCAPIVFGIFYRDFLSKMWRTSRYLAYIEEFIDKMKIHRLHLRNAFDLMETSVQSDLQSVTCKTLHSIEIVKSVHKLVYESLMLYRNSTISLIEIKTNAQNDDPMNYLCMIDDLNFELDLIGTSSITKCVGCNEEPQFDVINSVKKINSLVKLTNLQMSELLRRLISVLLPDCYMIKLENRDHSYSSSASNCANWKNRSQIISSVITRTQEEIGFIVKSLENLKSYYRLCYFNRLTIEKIRTIGCGELNGLGFNDTVIKPMASNLLTLSDIIDEIRAKTLSVSINHTRTKESNLNDIYSFLQEFKRILSALEKSASLGEVLISRVRHPHQVTEMPTIPSESEDNNDCNNDTIDKNPSNSFDTIIEKSDIYESQKSSGNDNSVDDSIHDCVEQKWREERDQLYRDQREASETNDLFGELRASFAFPRIGINHEMNSSFSNVTVESSDVVLVGEGEADENDNNFEEKIETRMPIDAMCEQGAKEEI